MREANWMCFLQSNPTQVSSARSVVNMPQSAFATTRKEAELVSGHVLTQRDQFQDLCDLEKVRKGQVSLAGAGGWRRWGRAKGDRGR